MTKYKLPGIVLLAALLFTVSCDSNPPTVATPIPPRTPSVAPTIAGAQASPTNPATMQPPTAQSTATARATLLVPATSTPAASTLQSPTPEATTQSGNPSPTTAGKGPAQGCSSTVVATRRDGLGDPLYPRLGNGGYDVLHYTLDLAVDMETNIISGTTTISAQATQDQDAFNLDFEGLTVEGIWINGNPAHSSRTGRELTITPSSRLREGEAFTVTVRYNGVPNPTDDGGAPFEIGWRRYSRGVFVASEPSGAATWYPANDHPCDKATYTMRVTVPEPYVVAANGTLKGEVDNGETRTYTWESRDTVASYLTTVNIGEFITETRSTLSGVPIRNYFPRTLDAEAKEGFKRTPEMIEYLESIFGPYPFEAYGVVVADTDLGFALETQTLSLFGRSGGGGGAESEEVVVHELSHQWFGNSVSLTSWRDIWLNEGFATYAQWLWLEHTEGKTAYEERINQMHRVFGDDSDTPPGDPPADNLFNASVYLRGGLTLHALRATVGDDAFFRTLQTYASRYKYGNASTQDFIDVAEEVSSKELSKLFDDWLYAKETPPLP